MSSKNLDTERSQCGVSNFCPEILLDNHASRTHHVQHEVAICPTFPRPQRATVTTVEFKDHELYPMRVVTRMTGLTADTIRAWERRYGAVTPARTDGNARRYSAEDVRRLSVLRELTEHGHAIGDIAALSTAEIEALHKRMSPPAKDPGLSPTPPETAPDEDGDLVDIRNAYLSAITRMDASTASEILLRATTFLDDRDLVYRLVLPIVQEVGVRYSHSELGISQEHLVSSQLRNLLATRARLASRETRGERLLMTTPEGHRHEFGILVASLLAAGRGFDVVYVGPDLPNEEIVWSVAMSRASAVVLSVVRDVNDAELAGLVHLVQALSHRVRVWIGCPAGHRLVEQTPGARHFHTLEAFEEALSGS